MCGNVVFIRTNVALVLVTGYEDGSFDAL